MKVVDELFTPGCPQCAVKHLSAALYHRAKLTEVVATPDQYMVEVCTAYINLVEVRAGYHSHFWYAVGALVRAEEHFAVGLGECVAREARLMLEQYGEGALINALRCIKEGTAPTHADWAAAHFDEARRELPAYADMMTMNNIVETIEAIRSDFFITDQEVAVDTSTEVAEEGGEEAMATKKTAKAKVAPKAAQAAAKGGKTAKACKGGKCCK